MNSVASSPSPARRYLSLDLFRLPSDRLLRLMLGRNWRCAGLAEKASPLAVYARRKGAFVLVALSEGAERLGLRCGQGLAEARAMIPMLESVEEDSSADAILLADIADWADRYTPLVALDGARGMMLDISGCAHLFGGEAMLLEDLLARLKSHGFAVRAAIADTPGAAHAAARFSIESIVSIGASAAMLARLPVAALRLPMETVFGLDRVGLKTLAHLLSAPRAPLAARFGALLLRRLDQALGLEEEAISPRRPAPLLMAERRLADPISEESDVRAILASLAAALEQGLESRGEGARRVELALFRVDGAVRRLQIGTSRPLRAAKGIIELFGEKFASLNQELDAGYGFDMMRLSVLASEEALPVQIDLDGTGQGEADLALLIDRIGARLGEASINRLIPRESHWPERAMVLVTAMLNEDAKMNWPPPEVGGPVLRPLRLFARGEPIEAIAAVPDGPPVRFRWRRVLYEIAHAEGPERLAPEWWRDGEEAFSRDYFRVEDEAGHRFWLYREGLYGSETTSPRWFLHGLCA